MSKTFGDNLIRTFFKFQNELKLYHWQTGSYSRHKATDKLFEKILERIDEFVEVYMGKFNKRVCMTKEPLVIRTFTEKNAIFYKTWDFFSRCIDG